MRLSRRSSTSWAASGFAFKRRIDKAVDVVVKELKKLSKPTKDAKEIAQVGTISANNNEAIGAIIIRFALQNAASVASLMLTTQYMVADKPKDEPAMPSMPPGGGGYPGMGM